MAWAKKGRVPLDHSYSWYFYCWFLLLWVWSRFFSPVFVVLVLITRHVVIIDYHLYITVIIITIIMIIIIIIIIIITIIAIFVIIIKLLFTLFIYCYLVLFFYDNIRVLWHTYGQISYSFVSLVQACAIFNDWFCWFCKKKLDSSHGKVVWLAGG